MPALSDASPVPLTHTQRMLAERPAFRALWFLARAYHGLVGPIERFFDERGITGAQFGVLRCLNDAGQEGLMLSDLSRRLLVTCGNITGVVDRLEQAGYLRRERSVEDRRVVRAQLTPEGRSFFAGLWPAYQSLLEELTAGLSADELTGLSRQAERLYQTLEAGRADLPPSHAHPPADTRPVG